MKYGSGASMRSVILAETEEVEAVLTKNGLSDADRETVMKAFREMAYQWCSSNAGACAMEDAVRKIYPDIREKKMRETFPF